MIRINALKNLLSPTTIPYYRQPLLITKGKFQYLWDAEGRKFLDMIGGIVTVSVGHCHPSVYSLLRRFLLPNLYYTYLYLVFFICYFVGFFRRVFVIFISVVIIQVFKKAKELA